MADERTPLIELKNITKVFPGVKALSDVCFTVFPGEVHALCGENGAGKSTLIKVMTGAHGADGGEYFIDGKPVHIATTQEGIAHGVSCVYQELSIAPQLDVAQNLFIGNLPMKGSFIDHKKLYHDAEDILSQLNMSISPKTLAGELSVGQQQMIEIGRALTRNARCIIMDEPTSSLSEAETDTLFKIIGVLQKRGIAIVYISHKLDEVMQLSDRITVIRDGMNVASLNTADTTQEMLITNMLGRSLDTMYNKVAVDLGEPVLEVKNLTRQGVFDNISFQVRAGEIVGFFGLVGAGRSEIMRAVFGVDKYDSGSVSINGKLLKSGFPASSIEAGMGFCTEDRKQEGLMLRLSILQNMTLVKLPDPSKNGVIDRKAQKELAESYVDSISIKTPALSQLAGNLSGGNQQKVVVAKWLMMDPQVLIVDEPTRGIDVGSKAEIYDLLFELAQRGVAIVMVSSEIEEIMGLCDRVVTICEGKKTSDLPITGVTDAQILAAALGKTDFREGGND